MSRIALAFSSFFRLLFGQRLHPNAAKFLPESSAPQLAPTSAASKPKASADDAADPLAPTAKIKPKRSGASEDTRQARTDGALVVLGFLQREGRLIDFLQESIDNYDDAAIGAAVRDIHRGCQKVLAEHFEIEAVMPGEEDASVSVPKGFDPGEIKLIGTVDGEPPFKGVLRHHGWRATKVKLPELASGVDREVLAPAEVEIGA